MKESRWIKAVGLALAIVIGLTAVAGPLSGIVLAESPEDQHREPGPRHHPRPRGPLAVVARELDMSVRELLNALRDDYGSIADLAEDEGAEPAEVVQALVEQLAEHLSNAEALNEEQVNWILSQAERKANGFVYVEFPFGAAIDVLQPAADAIGVPVDDLVDALQDGQSMADLAEANGVEPSTVEQAIIDFRSDKLDEAVQLELITQMRADVIMGCFSAKVPYVVSGDLPLKVVTDFLGGLPRPARP